MWNLCVQINGNGWVQVFQTGSNLLKKTYDLYSLKKNCAKYSNDV